MTAICVLYSIDKNSPDHWVRLFAMLSQATLFSVVALVVSEAVLFYLRPQLLLKVRIVVVVISVHPTDCCTSLELMGIEGCACPALDPLGSVSPTFEFCLPRLTYALPAPLRYSLSLLYFSVWRGGYSFTTKLSVSVLAGVLLAIAIIVVLSLGLWSCGCGFGRVSTFVFVSTFVQTITCREDLKPMKQLGREFHGERRDERSRLGGDDM